MRKFLFHLLCVIAAALCCFVFAMQRNWLWLCPALPVLLFAVWKFYLLYTQNTRKLTFLLDAIENNDPAIRFDEETVKTENLQVNRTLNRIAHLLYNVKQETAQREKYYELILNVVDTGVIVLNSKGAVHQKNQEALKLIGLDVLTHVSQLARVSDELMQTIAHAMPGDKLQVQIPSERGTVHLSMRVSSTIIQGEELRIIALNDINRELDEREIDSWIRLTHVLTHEMMNSITPVTSLSETLLTLPGAEDEEMRQGLETIHSTGKGLIDFVNSYRRLTRIPTPEPSLFYVRPFFERMLSLARHQHPCTHIRFTILQADENLILFSDESLIAQVMTNLLKNAIQAIGDAPNGEITLKAYLDEQESIHIEVANNGPAIPQEVREQMFVPFFTTKEEGSGIGLSLSKQIMRLSGGALTLLPYKEDGQQTVFMLTFR